MNFNLYSNTNLKKFIDQIATNNEYYKLYKILNPRLFDVSLRDGIQNIHINEQKKYTTDYKLEIYNYIIKNYKPNYIEIGSIVSEKIIPTLSDSVILYEKTFYENNNNFLLIPSKSKLQNAINCNCKNISLISSVSESFQFVNTKKTLEQTKLEINKIIHILKSNYSDCRIKLYLSCIDCCPISGKIPLDIIINEIKYYNDINEIDTICLSDTCGNLLHENFLQIINESKKNNISFEKISLHLHIDYDNIINTKQIFFSALDNKISEFDVSLLDTGGCVVTLKNNTKPNLSYELYFKFLLEYILLKINNAK